MDFRSDQLGSVSGHSMCMIRSFIIYIRAGPEYPGKSIIPDRSLTWSRIGGRGMPSKPAWFHRLPEILDALTGMDASHLDRSAVVSRPSRFGTVEKPFGVWECRRHLAHCAVIG